MATVLLQSIAAHRSDNHGLTNLLYPNMSHLLPSAVGFYCQYPGGEARAFWSIPCSVGAFQPHFCLLFPACFNLHVGDNGDSRNSMLWQPIQPFFSLQHFLYVWEGCSGCIWLLFGGCNPEKSFNRPSVGLYVQYPREVFPVRQWCPKGPSFRLLSSLGEAPGLSLHSWLGSLLWGRVLPFRSK